MPTLAHYKTEDYYILHTIEKFGSGGHFEFRVEDARLPLRNPALRSCVPFSFAGYFTAIRYCSADSMRCRASPRVLLIYLGWTVLRGYRFR